jgi:DNA replication protein DnaC
MPSGISPAMERVLERLSRKEMPEPPEDGPSPTEVEGRLRRAGIDRLLLSADVRKIDDAPRKQLGAWLSRKEKRVEHGQGLYMWGPVGTGKSMAAVSVVRELAKVTDSIKWWSTSDLMMELENPYHRQEMLRRLFNVRVLVLDDFGTQVLTAKYSEWLDQIGDARYRRRRSTIVTSNVQPGMTGLDRVMDRWRATMVEIEFRGRSRREFED